MALGALSGYYIMSTFCTLLDLFAPISWKTQESKSYFTIREWCQAIVVSSLNILLCSWLVTLPTWWMHKHGTLRLFAESSSSSSLTQFTAFWDWKVELPKQLFHIVFIDIWFFTTHRFIHVSRPINVYKWIHKFHHTFTAPCAPACMYAHPLEFCIGNVMGIILGPCITNCHPLTMCGWLTMSLVSTSSTHSGYWMLGAEGHDHHHEHFDYNYGTNVLMDRLFGTKFIGSEKHKRVVARKARKRREKVEEVGAKKGEVEKEEVVVVETKSTRRRRIGLNDLNKKWRRARWKCCRVVKKLMEEIHGIKKRNIFLHVCIFLFFLFI